jgi:hypothetical protein
MNAKQADGVRRRRTQAEVERIVSEYEGSGLGRQEFCDRHGLSLSTLNRHRKRKQVPVEARTRSRLIPVEISETKQRDASEGRGELLVWLTSGRRIEVRAGFDVKMLEQLVRVLEQA